MKKQRFKRGFTLTEMLIAVLLLGFVSIMATVMTSAVLSTSVTMKEVAQAEILGSEALDNLQGQLRFAQNVKVDGAEKNVTFDLDKNNTGYTFGVKEGEIVLLYGTGEGRKSETLFAGVSDGNLKVSELAFTLSEDGASVLIALSVSYGEKTLWRSNVSVKPLNGVSEA